MTTETVTDKKHGSLTQDAMIERNSGFFVMSNVPVRTGREISFIDPLDQLRYDLMLYGIKTSTLQVSVKFILASEEPVTTASLKITPHPGAQPDTRGKIVALHDNAQRSIAAWERAGSPKFSSLTWFVGEYMPKRKIKFKSKRRR